MVTVFHAQGVCINWSLPTNNNQCRQPQWCWQVSVQNKTTHEVKRGTFAQCLIDLCVYCAGFRVPPLLVRFQYEWFCFCVWQVFCNLQKLVPAKSRKIFCSGFSTKEIHVFVDCFYLVLEQVSMSQQRLVFWPNKWQYIDLFYLKQDFYHSESAMAQKTQLTLCSALVHSKAKTTLHNLSEKFKAQEVKDWTHWTEPFENRTRSRPSWTSASGPHDQSSCMCACNITQRWFWCWSHHHMLKFVFSLQIFCVPHSSRLSSKSDKDVAKFIWLSPGLESRWFCCHEDTFWKHNNHRSEAEPYHDATFSSDTFFGC